ncbi:MAG: ATP phosphoribosyltransferase regulatory subunit [Leptospirillia bacterium]
MRFREGSGENLRTPSKTTPTGVSPVFSRTARFRRETTDRLLALFSLYGYREIILPSFEYLDAISPGLDPAILPRLYLMQDRGSGQVLVLRPDATAQIARLSTQSFRDRMLPLRFSYSTSVFRDENRQASLLRELHQTGLELLGDASFHADLEVLDLCLRGSRVFPLESPLLVLSHAPLQEEYIRLPGGTREEQSWLRKSFYSRDIEALEEVFDRNGSKERSRIASSFAGRVLGLTEAIDLLSDLEKLSPALFSETSLSTFSTLLRGISGIPNSSEIRVDLALSPPGPYYTGMFFRMYARESSTYMASGGRYDRLGRAFGHDLPAVGFAYQISHIEEALRRREGEGQDSSLVLVIHSGSDFSDLESAISRLRSAKVPVLSHPLPEEDFSFDPEEALREHEEIRAVLWKSRDKRGFSLLLRGQPLRTSATLPELLDAIAGIPSEPLQ